jgi:hypothetical protein
MYCFRENSNFPFSNQKIITLILKYLGVKTEDRICKLCNTGVEDETHFLLQCPVLENKRTIYLHTMYKCNILLVLVWENHQ